MPLLGQVLVVLSSAAPVGAYGAGGPIGLDAGRGAAVAASAAADWLCLLIASRQRCRRGKPTEEVGRRR